MDSAGFTQIKFFSQSLQQIFAVTIFADKTVNDLFSIQFDLLQLFLLQTYVMNDGYNLSKGFTANAFFIIAFKEFGTYAGKSQSLIRVSEQTIS